MSNPPNDLLDLRSVPYYYIRGGAQGGPATPLEIRLPVKAGPQTIIVTFIKKTAANVDDLVQRPGQLEAAAVGSVARVALTLVGTLELLRDSLGDAQATLVGYVK